MVCVAASRAEPPAARRQVGGGNGPVGACVRRSRVEGRAWRQAGMLAAMGLALALGCASCAATRASYVPIPRAGEPGLRWPPLPVDGYVTRDGVRHELAGGFMVESGDSVVFLRAESTNRASILTVERAEVRRTFHRDSVASVVIRLDGDTPDATGAAIGGLFALALFYMVLIRGWPWWYGW